MKRSTQQSILLGTLLFLSCFVSGLLGWHRQTVIVPVSCIITIVLANRWIGLSPIKSLLIATPYFLIYLFLCFVIDVEYATYPIFFFGVLASVLTYLFLKYRVKPATSITVLVLLILFDGLFAWPNTLTYLSTKSNPGRYSLGNSQLVDVNNREIPMETLKGKVLVFDIWHSACYLCIKKFPEVQALYDDFKGDSSVRIISLNLPLEKDKGKRPTKFSDSYTFEKMYFLDENEYAKFSDYEVPLFLIIDKNGQCRFAGQLNSGWNIFIGNARRIINKLKNE